MKVVYSAKKLRVVSSYTYSISIIVFKPFPLVISCHFKTMNDPTFLLLLGGPFISQLQFLDFLILSPSISQIQKIYDGIGKLSDWNLQQPCGFPNGIDLTQCYLGFLVVVHPKQGQNLVFMVRQNQIATDINLQNQMKSSVTMTKLNIDGSVSTQLRDACQAPVSQMFSELHGVVGWNEGFVSLILCEMEANSALQEQQTSKAWKAD